MFASAAADVAVGDADVAAGTVREAGPQRRVMWAPWVGAGPGLLSRSTILLEALPLVCLLRAAALPDARCCRTTTWLAGPQTQEAGGESALEQIGSYSCCWHHCDLDGLHVDVAAAVERAGVDWGCNLNRH